MRRNWGRSGVAALALSQGAAALAQTTPPPTPPPSAGVPTGVPTREEIERITARPPVGAAIRLRVTGGVERAPCPLADPNYGKVRFTLRAVEFAGLKGASASDLRSSYAELVGREVPLATVCEIRDRAATQLRRMGYLAAVQVPPQQVSGGQLRFDVLMAHLAAVQVRGNAGRSEKIIAATLQPLTRREVFNQFEAERALLLARDIPGYDVRLTLRPAGAIPGEVVGDVTVDYTPVEADVTVQNYGSHEVGRWGGLARVQLNGLTGLADRTVLGIFSTADFEEQRVFQFGHDFALGGSGLRLGARLTRALTEPSLDSALDVKSMTWLATLEATYPFVRRQASTIAGTAGLDLINQTVRAGGFPLSRDRLRVAFARLDFVAVDRASVDNFARYSEATPRWRVGGSVELRRGVGLFGASDACGPTLACLAAGDTPPSRSEGDPQATLVRGRAFGELRPTPQLSLTFEPSFQYSADPLFAFEEYAAGNYTVGRGYDPGALTGDSAFGFRSELGYDFVSRRTAATLAFHPYAFYDSAWLWNRDRLVVEDDPLKLSSVGAGIRVALSNRLRLDATYAVPLKRVGFGDEKPGSRLLISLIAQLVPWGTQ